MQLSAQEILVVALVALIVLGPTRLPEAARTIGRVMREIRSVSTGFQAELRHALEDTEEEQAARDAGISYVPSQAQEAAQGGTRHDPAPEPDPDPEAPPESPTGDT